MNSSRFWTWFVENQGRFQVLRHSQDDDLLEELRSELHEYSSGLWFEIGGHPAEPMELVITAEGDSEFFGDVKSLVEAAPQIPDWKIIAFKPAHGFEFVTVYEEERIDPNACWFLPLRSPSRPSEVALRVAVTNYDESRKETVLAGMYVVIETGLGEITASERIALVELCSMPSSPESEGFMRLAELGAYLEWESRQSDV